MRFTSILLCTATLFAHQISAQTQLHPGDLQFLSFRSDAPDGLSFVLWKSIEDSTQVSFTDNGWAASDSVGFSNTTEGLLEWTYTGNSQLPKGSVISIVCAQGQCSSNIGLTSGSLGGLSTAGDQIFAFQGHLDSVHLIAGINFDGAGWANDRLNSNTSALPQQLSSVAFHLDEIDNAHYAGIRTGHTQSEYVYWISDMHNSWLTYNGDAIHVNANLTPFSIESPTSELTPSRLVDYSRSPGMNPHSGDSITTANKYSVGETNDDFKIYVYGNSIYWSNSDSPFQIQCGTLNSRVLKQKTISSTSGSLTIEAPSGILYWSVVREKTNDSEKIVLRSIHQN